MGVRRWLQAGCGIPHDGAHDTIVVLGGHPSVRCPAAVELWQAGRAPCITIVGGRLTDGVPTEVRKSAAVLHSLGMPGGRRAAGARPRAGHLGRGKCRGPTCPRQRMDEHCRRHLALPLSPCGPDVPPAAARALCGQHGGVRRARLGPRARHKTPAEARGDRASQVGAVADGRAGALAPQSSAYSDETERLAQSMTAKGT